MIETAAELVLVLAEVQSRRLNTVKRQQENAHGFCEQGLNEWVAKIDLLRDELRSKLDAEAKERVNDIITEAVTNGYSPAMKVRKTANSFEEV